MAKQETKVWYKSWTVWFNALGALVLALERFSETLPDEVQQAIAPVLVIGNLLLRARTKANMTITKEQ